MDLMIKELFTMPFERGLSPNKLHFVLSALLCAPIEYVVSDSPPPFAASFNPFNAFLAVSGG
ncbi:hypothetical protein, partial [Vibrio sp. Evd11]|uniref:hypothetical protein n=1 Tax=Vibrio sp. Evd11 TaxID=1207404 RepID=UPI001C1F596B